MKKSIITLFGVLAAITALQASAQTPAWFVLKHPEVKTMERMQAQEEAAATARNEHMKLASHAETSSHAMVGKSGAVTTGS